jgi:hypothetical protein
VLSYVPFSSIPLHWAGRRDRGYCGCVDGSINPTQVTVMYRERQQRFSPKRESAVNRGAASRLAAGHPKRAFEIALAIPDGGYRCQAMSEIGRVAADPLSERAFKEARAAAAAGDDDYQRAAVLAFAITAALGRGRAALAQDMLADALALIPSVAPVASRAYAFHLLWSACFTGGESFREPIWQAIVAHVHPDRNWRAARLYREIGRMAHEASGSKGRARVIAAMPDGKARRKIERDLAASLRR